MSVVQANLLALLWLPITAALALGPFLWCWGGQTLMASWPEIAGLPLLLVLLAASVLAHESLHLVGFRLAGGAPPTAVRLGFNRRTLTPFAACDTPITARAYRAAALLPALVLGLIPTAVALAIGSGWLALWSWGMLALAGGDLAAVWAIRRVPDQALVLDHPSRVGCRVIESYEL